MVSVQTPPCRPPGRRRLPFPACRGRWPAAKRPAGWGGTTSLIPTLVASSALTFTSPPCGEVGPDCAAVTAGWGDTTALILPNMDASISIDRIREAAEVIDPVFLDTPQFVCEPLSGRKIGRAHV